MSADVEGSPNQGSPLPTQPSPTQGPQTPINESELPKGQCRYILLVPEIKGQRCACVNFTLSRSMPSAMCDCGHLACFHLKTDEAVSTADKQEVELLKQRIQNLEQQLDRDTNGGFGSVVSRVSELEERLDKAREDSGVDIKSLYSNINQAWCSIQRLENGAEAASRVMQLHDKRIQLAHDRIKEMVNRQMELGDADELLEDRLESLESLVDVDSHLVRGRPRRKSTSDSMPRGTGGISTLRRRSSATRSTEIIEAAPLPFRASPSTNGPWTVHVSFLPDARQPFPFEKDTTAYKRCLSRGLHRMVVVANASAAAFISAIEAAFGRLLRGRTWMPLQAKLCDLKTLQGLPMLRPLDGMLQTLLYDAQFLKDYCAVCDAGGKMESLYIAMRSDTLSWHFLRHSPVFLDGLEECWEHDDMLDPNDTFDDDLHDRNRPSAADVTELPLKRVASEMSRAPSFGATSIASDGEGSRKMQRTTCMATMVDMPRRAEKV